MPLVNDPETPPAPLPPPGQVNATIAAPEYRHSLVDAKITPLSSLLVHIEGSSWTTDYYSQVLGADEEPSPYQPSQPGVYQQYLLVKSYELKLQGSLSISQDNESTAMTVTGSALLYPYLKPNYGDMFIADIGDGRAGLFVVNAPPVKKTILKETCWEIQFELTDYVTEVSEAQINSRVVKTTHFVKDFLTYGQNPVIAESDLLSKETFEKNIKNLLTRWLTLFYSQEFKTVLVPGQVSATYDPYVTATILKLFDRTEHPLIQRIKEINCDGLQVIDELLIWNTLINLDSSIMSLMAQTVKLVSAKCFNSHPSFDGVYYSGIGYVAVPNVTDSSVDGDYVSDGALSNVGFQLLNDYVWANVPTIEIGVVQVPYIHPVTVDDYYVLSQKFYDDVDSEQSVLELLVREYITGAAINKERLIALSEDAVNWGRLEQYYYIPVLIILLKASIRRI